MERRAATRLAVGEVDVQRVRQQRDRRLHANPHRKVASGMDDDARMALVQANQRVEHQVVLCHAATRRKCARIVLFQVADAAVWRVHRHWQPVGAQLVAKEAPNAPRHLVHAVHRHEAQQVGKQVGAVTAQPRVGHSRAVDEDRAIGRRRVGAAHALCPHRVRKLDHVAKVAQHGRSQRGVRVRGAAWQVECLGA